MIYNVPLTGVSAAYDADEIVSIFKTVFDDTILLLLSVPLPVIFIDPVILTV